eukprot:UN00370
MPRIEPRVKKTNNKTQQSKQKRVQKRKSTKKIKTSATLTSTRQILSTTKNNKNEQFTAYKKLDFKIPSTTTNNLTATMNFPYSTFQRPLSFMNRNNSNNYINPFTFGQNQFSSQNFNLALPMVTQLSALHQEFADNTSELIKNIAATLQHNNFDVLNFRRVHPYPQREQPTEYPHPGEDENGVPVPPPPMEIPLPWDSPLGRVGESNSGVEKEAKKGEPAEVSEEEEEGIAIPDAV